MTRFFLFECDFAFYGLEAFFVYSVTPSEFINFFTRFYPVQNFKNSRIIRFGAIFRA